MNGFDDFLSAMAVPTVIGFAAWVGALWRSHTHLKDEVQRLRVEFIEKFPNRDELDRIDQAVQRIDRRTDDMRDTLSEIKAALRWQKEHGE